MIAQVAPQKDEAKKPRSLSDLMATVSASRLSCFHQCRLKFYFRYVLDLKKPKTPALYVGTVVHSILQAWNLARWRRQQIGTEKLKALFDTNWQDQQKESSVKWREDEQDEKSSAWTMLETYFNQTPIALNEKPEAVEVSVEADLKTHGLPVVVGIIDLVRAGGKIVDFKTTGQTPNPDRAAHQNQTQLCCYSLLYRESTGRPESGLELHHLVKLKTPKIVVTQLDSVNENQRTKLFKIIESYVEGLRRGDFVPSPGLHCVSCEFFNECKRW